MALLLLVYRLVSKKVPHSEFERFMEAFRALAQDIPAFTLELTSFSMHPSAKYRCVFSLVDSTPPLQQTRQSAVRALAIDDDSPFFPHISLVYDPQQRLDSSTRERILVAIGPRALRGTRLNITAIEVWDTTNMDDYSSWRLVESVELEDSSQSKRRKGAAAHAEPVQSVSSTDVHAPFLRYCNELALAAGTQGNQPVGACLVIDGRIVLSAQNTVCSSSSLAPFDVTQHAELRLISDASRTISAEELQKATLYSSTEPCTMCCGAIMLARPGRVVFGASALAVRRLDKDAHAHMVSSCREVLALDFRSRVQVMGPLLESEALTVYQQVLQHQQQQQHSAASSSSMNLS